MMLSSCSTYQPFPSSSRPSHRRQHPNHHPKHTKPISPIHNQSNSSTTSFTTFPYILRFFPTTFLFHTPNTKLPISMPAQHCNRVVPQAVIRLLPDATWKELVEKHEACKDPRRLPKTPHHSTGYHHPAVADAAIDFGINAADVEGSAGSANYEAPKSLPALLPSRILPDTPAPSVTSADNEASQTSDAQPMTTTRAPRVRRDHHGKHRPYPLHRAAAKALPFALSDAPSPNGSRRSPRLRQDVVHARGKVLSPRRSSRLRQRSK